MSNADQPYLLVSQQSGGCVARGRAQFSFGYNQSGKGERSSFSAFWGWDGETLTVSGDRYGIVPFFYSVWGSSFAISNSIDQLLELGAPRDLNTVGVATFFQLGYYIGDNTPFKHIHALAPGAQLEWKAGALTASSKKPDVGRFEGDRNEALDAYIETFSASMKGLTPNGRVAVPLSGGRDSRHILLELNKQDRLPDHCLTTEHQPPRRNEDMRIARLLAADVGVKHVALQQSSNWLAGEQLKNSLTNYCSHEHGWLLPIARHLASSADSFFDGLAGDTLSQQSAYTPEDHDLYAEGRLAELAEGLLAGRRSLWVPSTQEVTLRREFQSSHTSDDLAHELVAELSLYSDLPNPLAAYHFGNRTRRAMALAPLGMLSQDAAAYLPYIEQPVFDHLMSCPAHFVKDLTFHSDAIERGYPEYSHVPYEGVATGDVGKSGYWRKLSVSLALMLLQEGRTGMLNRRKLLPRLLYNALKLESIPIWFHPNMVVCIAQLGAKAKL